VVEKKAREYRTDVNWARDNGMDTNFATKLALKAQAVKQWTVMSDTTDDEALLEEVAEKQGRNKRMQSWRGF